MVAFIDDYRDVYGFEPICHMLPIASSTYRAIKAQQADPARQWTRAKRDAALRDAIHQIWEDTLQVYGTRGSRILRMWRPAVALSISPS